MIHITFSPQLRDARTENPSEEEWVRAVLSYQSFAFTYYEKSKADRKKMKVQLNWLKKNTPEKYKTGVHLLRDNAGFMGEHVYWVDGQVDTTIHSYCPDCKQPRVLNTNQVRGLWCANCEKKIDDTVTWEEAHPEEAARFQEELTRASTLAAQSQEEIDCDDPACPEKQKTCADCRARKNK